MKRESHERSLETLVEKFESEAAVAKLNRKLKAEKTSYYRGVEDANLAAAKVIKDRIKASQREGVKDQIKASQRDAKKGEKVNA